MKKQFKFLIFLSCTCVVSFTIFILVFAFVFCCMHIFQVSYTQWVSTDRCELVSINEESSDFVDKFFDNLEKLKKHSFVAQNQHKVKKYSKLELTVF